jgi:hypothetical protein
MTLLLGFYLPVPENQILAIFIRSVLMMLLFGGLVYFLKLLPEGNELIQKQLRQKGIRL